MDADAVLADPMAALDAPDLAVRRLAISILSTRIGEGPVQVALSAIAAGDPDPRARAEAVEVLGGAGMSALEAATTALDDPEPIVVEAAVTALGEIASPVPVPRLVQLLADHPDRMVQEAAAAALGAIGDDRAVEPLLEVLRSGAPQLRRRAVVALTVFDAPEIENALRTATADRNPMVREVAEMVIGRPPDEGWQPLELRPPPATE